MRFNDDQFMITAQLSFLGIVMVFGMFFMWRTIGKVESKVNLVLERMNNADFLVPGNPSMRHLQPQDMAHAKEMQDAMEQIFGELGNVDFADPAMMVLSTFEEGGKAAEKEGGDGDVCGSGVEIQEIDEHQDVQSEVGTNATATHGHGTISRSRLMKMNLDTLKERCMALGVSCEGTKRELTDRIVQAIQEQDHPSGSTSGEAQ